MFGTKTARIAQLQHKVTVLESNLSVTERRLDSIRRERDMFRRGVLNRDEQIAKLNKELANPFRTTPHEHNFSELEARVVADMLARPELYGNVKEEMMARGYGMSFGRWSARSPQLQNIPRPEPALVNISFEYNGKRSTFPLGNSTIKLELEERDGGNVTRVICHKPDNSIVHYDYRTASITSEIRKEYK